MALDIQSTLRDRMTAQTADTYTYNNTSLGSPDRTPAIRAMRDVGFPGTYIDGRLESIGADTVEELYIIMSGDLDFAPFFAQSFRARYEQK